MPIPSLGGLACDRLGKGVHPNAEVFVQQSGNGRTLSGWGERGAKTIKATRVILVGSTGLEALGPGEEGLTLIQAKSPLAAMGELSRRHGAEDGPPAVVVGWDVIMQLGAFPRPLSRPVTSGVSATGAGSGSGAGPRGLAQPTGQEPRGALERESAAKSKDVARSAHFQASTVGEAGEAVVASRTELDKFLSGVRYVAPKAWLVGVVAPGLVIREGFDVTVPVGSDAASVARAVRGDAPPVSIAPDGENSFGMTDSVAGVLTHHLAGDIGDNMVLEGLLLGADLAPLCLELITLRLGTQVRLVVGQQDLPIGPSAWVERDGTGFGWLVGSADQSVLARHAAWLAGWLHLRAMHGRLRRAAFTDHLTGAWNRRYFERFLGAAINNARQNRRHVTVLVFDIDDFKKYNDTYGHELGDEILAETVRLMRSVIRPTDRVCRIGGDEFAVVFHDPEGPRVPGSVSNVNVVEVTQRFRKQLSEHRFPRLSQALPGVITVSGGMASFPWDGASVAELLRRADQLAMESKASGKNNITFGAAIQRPGPGDAE